VRARHQFVRAAAGINNSAGISVVTVQSLVAAGYGPDDRVVNAVRGGDERRAASVLVRPPSGADAGWAGCSNAESRDCVGARAKGNIRGLVSPVRGRRLHDEAA
jgi:hypothetical protein